MDREKMRLIDANAEKAKVDVLINSLIFGDEDEDMLEFMDTLKQLLRNAFDAAPTVDAVEVVRCKNCMNSEPVPNALRWLYLDSCIHCTAHDTIMESDGFCSYGERSNR